MVGLSSPWTRGLEFHVIMLPIKWERSQLKVRSTEGASEIDMR